MLRESIVSLQNPLIKRFRAVREGRESSHIFIEGVRLSQEAVDARMTIESVIHTPDFASAPAARKLVKALDRCRCRGAVVSDKLMKYVCETVTPQGIAMIARPRRWELDDVFAKKPFLVIVLDGLQDPGNLGTIIRSAEAAGATGVALTPGCVRTANPKVVRSSMGSLFRLPVVELPSLAELRLKLNSLRVPVYAALPDGEFNFLSRDYSTSLVFLVGGETHGISRNVLNLATTSIRIPMSSPVDSLNAGVAASILLFEAARQRRLRVAGPQRTAR